MSKEQKKFENKADNSKENKEKQIAKKERKKLIKERWKRIKKIKNKEKQNNQMKFTQLNSQDKNKNNQLKDYKKMSIIEKLKYNVSGGIFKNFVRTTIDGLQITFLGATKTVTGSKYLIESNKSKILVDCGLFQGIKELRLRNWAELPINPKHIDAIILTHAHLDHTGYVPLLVKNGFKGKIYCTRATNELSKLILPDSGFLQEEEARYAKKKGFSKHNNPKALYTQKDAVVSLKKFVIVDFYKEIKIDNEFSFSITKAGHILGAGSVLLKTSNQKTILFSGDIGRNTSPLVSKPESLPCADYILCETTYGNRLHKENTIEEDIANIVNKTIAKGGKVVIPAFAVGRAQEILYYIHKLIKKNEIPKIPIFLDSPMSIKVTSLADDYGGEGKLTKEEYKEIYKDVKFCITRVQSKKIFDYLGSAIIISASGMLAGGRVLHHIANYGQMPNCTIVLVGYQAEGTRGRDLQDGKKELKIHGQIIPIRAKIETLGNMSGHADANELIEWLKTMPQKPKKFFAIHGEEEQARIFADRVKDELNWDAFVPDYLETLKL